MYTRNAARQKSDMLYYRTYDSYSMPERLREAREKYKNCRLPPSPEPLSLPLLGESDDVEEDEGLPPGHSDRFTGVLYMVAHRIYASIAWVLNRGEPFIPAPIRRLRIHEGIQRLMGYTAGAQVRPSPESVPRPEDESEAASWASTNPTLIQIENTVVDQVGDSQDCNENKD